MAKIGINNLDELPISGLSCLLGEERVEKIKDAIADLIIERVREDLSDYDSYIFYPPDWNDDLAVAYEKAKKKSLKMYEAAILEMTKKDIEEQLKKIEKGENKETKADE